MGVRDWAARTADRVRNEGRVGVRIGLQDLYRGLWRRVGWHVPRGTNVFDREWNTLVVLDACRVDLLRAVVGDYDFLDGVGEPSDGVGTIGSVGSMTEEWQGKTFTDARADELARTAYVTANPFSDRLDPGRFAVLAEVWRYGWDEDLGVVPPRAVTDRAVRVAREYDPERLVVHYMQPHRPLIGSEVSLDDRRDEPASDPPGNPSAGSTNVRPNEPRPPTGDTPLLGALRRGEVSREAVLEGYEANLRLALEEVAVLLANHDAATAAVTADHGNAFGEWGVYGHPAGCLVPAVREVPWVETRSTDEGTRDPPPVGSTERERLVEARETPELAGGILDDGDVEDVLAALDGDA